ncbi:hypothetical protein [Micromonospora sp. NPDC023888]|uniref:hypothetical protein n=1 Tax=Micromonospora sp. NPDC023888 TaxID=3155607 RepID=UPI0033E145EF
MANTAMLVLQVCLRAGDRWHVAASINAFAYSSLELVGLPRSGHGTTTVRDFELSSRYRIEWSRR